MSSESEVYLHSVKVATMTSESDVYLHFVKRYRTHSDTYTGTAKSAGFDLRSPYETTVPAREKELIKTDLQIKLREGCYSRIERRTDLALFRHLEITGIVDETM